MPIELEGPPPRFVGRGGLKLEGALDRFGIGVSGRRVLDAGASTGGFTDLLLQRGAAVVVAVDVGRGQLDDRIAADPRVEVHDRTNIRHSTAEDLGGTFDLIVADLSFISLCTVAPALVALADPGGDLVVLVKPQFEVGRAAVGRGGIVRDPSLHRVAVEKVARCLEEAGAGIRGVTPSPIEGAKGNREFFAWAVAGEPSDPTVEVPV